jgi:hypothetical protein
MDESINGWMDQWFGGSGYRIRIDKYENTNVDEGRKEIVVNRRELVYSYMIYRMEEIGEEQIRGSDNELIGEREEVIEEMIEEMKNGRLIVIDRREKYEGIWDIKELMERYGIESREDMMEYIRYNMEEYKEYIIEKLKRVNRYDIRRNIEGMIKMNGERREIIEKIGRIRKMRKGKRRGRMGGRGREIIICEDIWKKEEDERQWVEMRDSELSKRKGESLLGRNEWMRERVNRRKMDYEKKRWGRKRMGKREISEMDDIWRFGRIKLVKRRNGRTNKIKLGKMRKMRRERMMGDIVERIMRGVNREIDRIEGKEEMERKREREMRRIMERRRRVRMEEIEGGEDEERKEIGKNKRRGKRIVIREEMRREIDEMREMMRGMMGEELWR